MKNPLLKDSFFSIFNLVSLVIASIVESALTLRFLPKEIAGVWFIFISLSFLLSYCDFGLSPTISREIGFAMKKKNISLRAGNLFYTMKRLIFLLAISSALIAILGGYFYFSHILPKDIFKHTLIPFLLYIFGAMIRLSSNPYLTTLYGHAYVSHERFIKAIGPLSGIIIAAIALNLGLGIYGLILGWLCNTTIIFCLAYFFSHKLGVIYKKGHYLPRIVQRIWNPCLQWFLMSVGGYLIFQAGNFLVGFFLGASFVPQYSIFVQIITAIMFFSGFTQIVIRPYISKAQSLKQFDVREKLLFLSYRISMSMTIMLSIYFFYFYKTVITLWLGTTFTYQPQVLFFLLLTALLEMQHTTISNVAMAAGYVKFATISLSSAALTIALSCLLIPHYGVTGAAFAVFIAQLTTNNWYVVFVSLRFLKVKPSHYAQQVVKLIIFACFMIVPCYFLPQKILLVSDNKLIQLIGSALITLIFAILFFYSILLSKHERLLMKSALFKRVNHGKK